MSERLVCVEYNLLVRDHTVFGCALCVLTRRVPGISAPTDPSHRAKYSCTGLLTLQMQHKLEENRAGRPTGRFYPCSSCYCVCTPKRETLRSMDKPEEYDPHILDSANLSQAKDVKEGQLAALYQPLMDAMVANSSSAPQSEDATAVVVVADSQPTPPPAIPVAAALSVQVTMPTSAAASDATPMSPPSLPALDRCTCQYAAHLLARLTQWDYHTDRDPLQADWVEDTSDPRVTYPAPLFSVAYVWSVLYLALVIALRIANLVVVWYVAWIYYPSQSYADCCAL